MQFPIHDGELPILWFRSPQLAVKSFILRSDSSRNHIMFIQMYMYIHTYVGTSILVYIYIHISYNYMHGWLTHQALQPPSRLTLEEWATAPYVLMAFKECPIQNYIHIGCFNICTLILE
jgi:hypothetical protein